jgi:hypothetical protein
MERPIIRNGRSINQISGKSRIITMARGQQRANNMHQRIIAIKVFIEAVNNAGITRSLPITKSLPIIRNSD